MMHAVEWIEQHGRFRRIIGAQDLRNALRRQKGECTWCAQPVPKRRQTWCSEACVDDFLGRCSPQRIRSLVERRDKGVCAECGRDTTALERLLRRIRTIAKTLRPREACTKWSIAGALKNRRGRKNRRRVKRYRTLWSFSDCALRRWLRQQGMNNMDDALWEADHIVPVSEGGGLTTIENYRTLCIPCHKQASRELAARRAKPKPPRREPREGQRQRQLL